MGVVFFSGCVETGGSGQTNETAEQAAPQPAGFYTYIPGGTKALIMINDFGMMDEVSVDPSSKELMQELSSKLDKVALFEYMSNPYIVTEGDSEKLVSYLKQECVQENGSISEDGKVSVCNLLSSRQYFAAIDNNHVLMASSTTGAGLGISLSDFKSVYSQYPLKSYLDPAPLEDIAGMGAVVYGAHESTNGTQKMWIGYSNGIMKMAMSTGSSADAAKYVDEFEKNKAEKGNPLGITESSAQQNGEWAIITLKGDISQLAQTGSP